MLRGWLGDTKKCGEPQNETNTTPNLGKKEHCLVDLKQINALENSKVVA